MNYIKASTMNCQGQTKLMLAKQLFIQNHVKNNNIDVLLCQETRIEEGCFNHCENILNNYTIIKNNSYNFAGRLENDPKTLLGRFCPAQFWPPPKRHQKQ